MLVAGVDIWKWEMGFDLEDRKKVNSSEGGCGVIDTWNNYGRKAESTSCSFRQHTQENNVTQQIKNTKPLWAGRLAVRRTDRPKQQWSSDSPRTAGQTETGRSSRTGRARAEPRWAACLLSPVQNPCAEEDRRRWVGSKQQEWGTSSTQCCCLWVYFPSVYARQMKGSEWG